MATRITFENSELANLVSAEAFRNGLIIETAGPNDEVLKFLGPLTTDEETLEKGLRILSEAIETSLSA